MGEVVKMQQSKKYNFRISQDNAGWVVEITRRVTSKRTVVTKSQDGFETEAEAQDWGEKEVKTFLKNLNLNEQKKRRSKESEKQ